jgi:hypothetical protein
MQKRGGGVHVPDSRDDSVRQRETHTQERERERESNKKAFTKRLHEKWKKNKKQFSLNILFALKRAFFVCVSF